jgi:hypothetical protein
VGARRCRLQNRRRLASESITSQHQYEVCAEARLSSAGRLVPRPHSVLAIVPSDGQTRNNSGPEVGLCNAMDSQLSVEGQPEVIPREGFAAYSATPLPLTFHDAVFWTARIRAEVTPKLLVFRSEPPDRRDQSLAAGDDATIRGPRTRLQIAHPVARQPGNPPRLQVELCQRIKP